MSKNLDNVVDFFPNEYNIQLVYDLRDRFCRWIEVFRSTKSEMESIIYPDEPLDSYPAMYSHDIDLYGQPPMYGMRGRPPPPHMYPGGPGPYGPPPHG